jgi:hypothetical protein
MLNMHPDICISPENTCFEFLFMKLKQNNHQQLNKEKIKDLLINDKKLNSWPNYNLDLNYLLNEEDGITNLIKKIMISYSNSQNKTPLYFGNKKGFYARGLGETVKKKFPHSKFIFIYRDPRDIVISSLKSFKDSTLSWVISEICVRHSYIKYLKEKYNDDVLILNFENLVLNPEIELKKICNFLNLKYEKKMIDLIGETAHIHKNSTKALDPNLIFKWRKNKKLNYGQLKLINYFTKDIINLNNYENTNYNLGLKYYFRKRKISDMIENSNKNIL